MAGKKKNMQGGIFGLNPSYENKIINDIAYKIISGKKNENKIRALSWINSNYLRAEQRINAFFQKLNLEIEGTNLDENRSRQLFGWFKEIIGKYPDKIEEIMKREIEQGERGHFFIAYNFFKKKYPNEFVEINKLKYLVKKQNQHSAVNVKLPNQNQNSLISEFNDLYNELRPNKTGKTGIIKLSNNDKEQVSNRIVNLAKKIYDKAILLKSSPDFIALQESLYKLYDIYRAIFIEEFRQNISNVEGVANNKKDIALNLMKKDKYLKQIYKNQQQIKNDGPMSISYPAPAPAVRQF